MPRLLEKYKSEIVPKMKERFDYQNLLAIPKLEKITINMGLGEAIQNPKALEAAAGEDARPRTRRRSAWRQPALPLQRSTPSEDDPPLIAAMRQGPLSIDELAAALGCSALEVQQQAMEWELRGRIVRVGGRLRLTDG